MAVELVFEKRSKLFTSLSDSLIMIKRSGRHIIRNRDQLLGAFFQPIMFLVLFSTVFGGAISKALPPGVSYLNFLMAGIIVQTAAFGSTTTAIAVCNDMQKGIVDRFRSLRPVDRTSTIVRIEANGFLFILATPIALTRVRRRLTTSVWLSKRSARTQEIFSRFSSRSIRTGIRARRWRIT